MNSLLPLIVAPALALLAALADAAPQEEAGSDRGATAVEPPSETIDDRPARSASGKASEASGGGDRTPPGSTAQTPSDSELRTYREIRKDIASITEEYKKQMADQQVSPEERANLQTDYARKVEAAIRERGWDTGQYNRTRSRVLANPALLDNPEEPSDA